ncbi:hypothetical protein ACIQC7_34990 [Kitasatospora sp. NPDC088556]|uniref:hypothetical protein n=1 Tax=Kitasatospora sp. NPDC088556 TaxID=3364076 RepID=UPI00381FD1D8
MALQSRRGHVGYESSQFRAGVRAPAVGKIDDINRLRMYRADDQDVLDLIRSLMSFDVTLILTGVNIPGTGLLREAVRNPTTGQLMLPPLEGTRVHGLEVTQIERRNHVDAAARPRAREQHNGHHDRSARGTRERSKGDGVVAA